MREMKDSGIEWIGEIPDGWSVERLKYHIDFNPSTSLPKYDDTSAASFLPMECLKSGSHTLNETEYQKVKKGYVIFQNGDILMAKVTPCLENGNLAIAHGLNDGVGFGSTEINVIRCKDINREYLFYILQTPTFIDKAVSNMFGVAGLKRLNPDFIPNAVYPIPSIDLQEKIVDYLDKKCDEIDALIAAKEKTNALLKERRQSIIYEAVTKGLDLDPNAKMKDSGVEWIGEIPDGWHVTSLKRIGTTFTGSTPSKNNHEYWDGDIPWLSSKDIKADYLTDSEDHITKDAVEQCGLTVFNSNTLVFCVRSGILRHTFPVAIAKTPTTINQDLRALLLSQNVCPDYLLYYLKGMNDIIVTLYQKTGATVESIEMEWFSYLPVVLPPLEEQKAIAQHLTEACNSIDSIVTANEKNIAKLKEYRQSVIYEAVTGKTEVTNAVH